MGTGAQKKPTKKPKPKRPKERLRPVSLHPLEFDAAMRGILASRTGAEQEDDTSRDDEIRTS